MCRHRKAQVESSLAVFIVVLMMIIILAPVTLKIVRSILPPLGANLGTIVPGAESGTTTITNTASNLWDFGMVFIFVLMAIMMMISAYFVDLHPMFVIIYIITGFLLFMIVPSMESAVTGMYNTSQFINETNYLPLTYWIGDHFGMIVLSIYVITGVILFAKVRMAGRQ